MLSSQTFRVFVVLAAAVACAGRAPSSSGEAAGTGQVSRNRDVITEEELSDPARRAETVLDVIRTLRPQFLTQRGKNSHSDDEAGKVHVSVDNGRIVPLEELSNMHANSVTEIRYLNVAAAMAKFGGAAREGPVILVRTSVK